MKKLMLIVVLMVTLLPLSASAVKVTGLFHADLPVGSQSDDERAQAVKLAFSQLLIKLTGNPNIEADPTIKEAIQRADYYVEEFSYSLPTTNSATYFIHISFESDDVKRLLRREGIPFWGENRPLILVWLAVTDDKQSTEIIGNETPGDILDQMKYQGSKFALPLIFPLMDVTDMGQISTDEVNSMALPALRKAGKRYSPNAYLIGKIEAKDGGFQSEWQLILNKDVWSWSISDKTTDAVVTEVLYQASQVLAKRYNVRS